LAVSSRAGAYSVLQLSHTRAFPARSPHTNRHCESARRVDEAIYPRKNLMHIRGQIASGRFAPLAMPVRRQITNKKAGIPGFCAFLEKELPPVAIPPALAFALAAAIVPVGLVAAACRGWSGIPVILGKRALVQQETVAFAERMHYDVLHC
jgi:hypothetical protein